MDVFNALRDASVILLAAQAFACALVPLALSAGVVYGVWWLRRDANLPAWLRTGREYFVTGLSYVDRAMDIVAKPIFAVSRFSAAVEARIRMLTRAGGD